MPLINLSIRHTSHRTYWPGIFSAAGQLHVILPKANVCWPMLCLAAWCVCSQDYRLYTVCIKCIFLFHLNWSCLASGISNSQNMLVVMQRRNTTCVRQFSSNLQELYSTWFVHSCSKMITNRLQAAGWCHNFKTFKRCFCAPCQACEKKKKRPCVKIHNA